MPGSTVALAAVTSAALAFATLRLAPGAGLDAVVLVAGVPGLLLLACLAQDARTLFSSLHRVLQSAPDPILVTDADGTIVFSNHQVTTLLGYPPDELIGRTIEVLVPPESTARHVAHRRRYQHRPEPRRMGTGLQLAAVRRDGDTVDVDIALGPVGAGGLVTCIVRDVAERTAAADRIRELAERLQAIVDHSPVVIAVKDLEGRYELANDELRGLVAGGEVIGRTDAELFAAPEAESVRANDLRVLEEDRPLRFEERVTVGGSTRTFLTAKVPLHDEDGRPVAICGVSTDITDRVAAEEVNRRNARYVRQLLASSPDPMVAVDEHGTLAVLNHETERFLGYEPDELAGRRVDEIWPPRLRTAYHRQMEEFVASGRTTGHAFGILTRRKDGVDLPVEISLNVVDTDDGRLVLMTARDVSERLRFESQLRAELDERRAAEAKLAQRAAQQAAVASLGQLALERRPVTELIVAATGHVSDTLAARARVARQVGEPAPKTARIAATIGIGDSSYGTLLVEAPETRSFAADEVDFVRAIAHVLAGALELERTEGEMRHRALHDPLTGLPNRTLLSDRLGQALAGRHRDSTWLAVMFLDLDRFKVINDSLGHQAGDDLLAALPGRLQSCLRPGDTLARLGGDEFVVLCDALDDSDEAKRIAERILTALQAPFLLAGDPVVASSSIGIALAAPGVPHRAADLMRDADAAMYVAKEHGRGRFEVFEDPVRQRSVGRLRLEAALRRALEEGSLGLGYQPIVDIATGRITAVEALLRWEDRVLGAVSPDELIPLAEDTGLITPVGAWTLQTACAQVAAWRREPGSEALRLAVNLSPRQLLDASIVDVVADALHASGLPADALDLEITESALLDEGVAQQQALAMLSASGVRLHLDDFGTGYSSLTYLKRFPIDAIKIDRSFVAGLGSDPEDDTIVGVLVNLAHGLGLSVVAEGVETLDQLGLLRELGCEEAQGYLFAPALSAGDLDRALAGGLGGGLPGR